MSLWHVHFFVLWVDDVMHVNETEPSAVGERGNESLLAGGDRLRFFWGWL